MDSKKTAMFISLLLLLLVIGWVYFSQSSSTFCGGIQGKSCPVLFSCDYEGNYPDASGTCKFLLNKWK